MNSVLMTLILSMWVRSFISDYDQAHSRFYFISGMGSTCGMISAVIYGFIYERATMKLPLLINNICIFLGVLSLIFINNPNSGLVFISFSLISFGFYGHATVGFIIVNKNVGCRSRGAVMGVNSWAGAVEILFLIGVDIVTGKQIGRASCRERV